MDICICVTDSPCCMPETNTTLWVNYTSIKIFKKEVTMTFIFSTEGNAETLFKIERPGFCQPRDGIGDHTWVAGSGEVINKYLLDLLTSVMETSMNMLLENRGFCHRLLSLLLEKIWRISRWRKTTWLQGVIAVFPQCEIIIQCCVCQFV